MDALGPILRRFERVISVSPVSEVLTTNPNTITRNQKQVPLGSKDYWFKEACTHAFDEFCHNKIFGIDSYLSRRIRHGTLGGTLVTPIQQKIRHFRQVNGGVLSSEDHNVLEILLGNYKRKVDHIKDNLLHFRSENRPEGLLFPGSIRTRAREKMQAEFHDRMVEYLVGGFAVSDLCPLFIDYCWNLLTEDLVRIQQELRKYFGSTIRPLLRAVCRDKRNDIMWKQFATDLDQTAETLFISLLQWFSKSEGSSMTVTIRELVTVVVREAKTYQPSYGERFRFDVGGEESLSGLTYQVVYDLLSLLFNNIAQHADPESETVVSTMFVNSDEKKNNLLHVSVVSKNRINETDDAVKSVIESAMSEGNVADSMVREGRSGLGKAKALVESQSENCMFNWFVEDGRCRFEFSIPVIVVGAQ